MITKLDKDWWKETTVYQIYPRSFKDSNGDGIGDLQGIISRLDYIKDLGFETIWISPFFESPQEDVGYDISDYQSIAPEYGTMADFHQLIEGIHNRDMKLVLDMVMNHTSDKHPWFIESASSKDNPKRDWYIWRDGRGWGKPPNNWLSQVKGSGWQYDEKTGQWYWAAFLPFQPDLNYRNRDVKETMFNILRFWLDKGVDGFRLDIIGAIFEDEQFRNNPFSFQLIPSAESNDKMFRSASMVENLPETIEFVKELRSVVDEYHGRFLLGETFGSMDDLKNFTGRDQPDGLHAAFIFKCITTPFKRGALRKLIDEFEAYFPDPWIPTWVYANHDSMRRRTWFKDDEKLQRLQVLLQHTARGIPITYQGEEIAMKQAPIPHRKSLDPVAAAYSSLPVFLFEFLNRITHGGMNRDGCRTPMQWDDTLNSGFSNTRGETWLPINDDFAYDNVSLQKSDRQSLLNLYRSLLKLRHGSAPLKKGSIELIEIGRDKNIFAYERTFGSETLTICMNLSRKKRVIKFDRPVEILLSTDLDTEKTEEGLISIEPWQGIILI